LRCGAQRLLLCPEEAEAFDSVFAVVQGLNRGVIAEVRPTPFSLRGDFEWYSHRDTRRLGQLQHLLVLGE
jgi:hypothetical protein